MRRLLISALLVLLAAACRDRDLFDKADAFYRAADYDAAAAEYARLRESFAQQRDQENEWRARLWWARSVHLLGQNKEAAAELESLMRVAAGHPRRDGWTRCSLGLVRARAARYDEAITEGRRGLELARRINDRSLAAICYDTVVTALSHTGRHRESLALNEQRIAAERRRKAPPLEMADALNDIGIDYRRLGRFEEGIAVYQEALGLYRKLENPEGIAKALYNMANIYASLGDLERMIALKKESLRHAEQMGHAWGLGLLHSDLGAVLRERGSPVEARSHLQSALEIARGAGLPFVEVHALDHLGRLDTAQGKYDTARSMLKEGIAVADARQIATARARLRAAAARNEAAAGRGPDAVRWADQALRIARELADPEIEFEALEARAAALEASSDPRAHSAYLDTIELLESWRGRLALGDLRIGVAERRLGVYEGAIRILVARGRSEEAFEVAERARARVLLALMAARDARDAARSAEEALKQKLRETYEARRSVPEDLRPALDHEIVELTSQLASAEAVARAANPVLSRLQNPLPEKLREVRATLLNSGAGLVAFFWGDADVYGWWITDESARAVRLGPSDSLGSLVETLRSAVEQSVSNANHWKTPAQKSFQQFVLPLAPEVANKVFVVPDGPLAYLPVEVMIPPGSHLPWGASAEFAYGPSASVLVGLARREPAQPFARTLLAVGDPGSKSFSLAALFPGRRDDRKPLPYAAREVRWIAQALGSRGADTLIGRQATVTEWLARRPQRYRYLHFATHARVHDRDPMKTALKMADGELDVQRIRRLWLPSELVTLSACETALGRRVRGEGIIGLPHAFLAAGARGVVVTLWRVPDDSAADFVHDFYRELARGHGPARALHHVRRNWMAKPPYQWAPFILVGGLS